MVRAPWWMHTIHIEQFVSRHQPWIEHKIESLKAIHSQSLMVRGEVQYLGVRYPLAFAGIDDNLSARLLKLRVEHWYKKKAKEFILARVDHFAEQLDVHHGLISFRNQKSRWGSCSARGTLSFNWRLVMASPEVIDYVVVHELTHLVHHNHSRQFWATLGELMPDYKARRRWLDDHGRELIV